MDITQIVQIISRAGGGGSGGSSGGGGVVYVAIFIVMYVIAWFMRRRKIKKAKQMQKLAAASDSSWSRDTIQSTAQETFNRFQADWSVLDSTHMQEYMTTSYFNHINLMMFAMRQMKRQNLMHNLKPPKIALMEVSDSVDDNEDSFVVEILSQADDTLVEFDTNKTIYVDSSGFKEYWQFKKQDGRWLLNAISQDGGVMTFANNSKTMQKLNGALMKASKNMSAMDSSAASSTEKAMLFSVRNNFYYNADFGWLLMPKAGSLFSPANFKTSDINHHIIGVYKDVLVQFFEYLPYASAKKKPIFASESTRYVVAAVTLPKSYGNILVRRKSFFFKLKPIGLTRVKTESIDFNRKYQLYASDMDRVNSFELLHPAYILQMQSLKFKVNLEIIDNTLYMFSRDKKADYDQMLDLLQKAFKEMKM